MRKQLILAEQESSMGLMKITEVSAGDITENNQQENQLFRKVLVGNTHVDRNGVQFAIGNILHHIGEDPEREGLQKTPERVARMFEELTAGYHVNPEALVNGAIFHGDYDDMVIVRNIGFYSLCEHHLLPFHGQAHVAYMPDGKVIGLSKIPRIVEMYARRLQIQEQMTRQIADFLWQALKPKGVAVLVEGAHMCAMMRGVKKETTRMTTTSMLGIFRENDNRKNEFLAHVYR